MCTPVLADYLGTFAVILSMRRDGRMIFYTLDDHHLLRLFEQGLEHVEESHRRTAQPSGALYNLVEVGDENRPEPRL